MDRMGARRPLDRRVKEGFPSLLKNIQRTNEAMRSLMISLNELPIDTEDDEHTTQPEKI